jgi:hypothetical protein
VRIRWATDDVTARVIGGSLLATFVAAVVSTFVAVRFDFGAIGCAATERLNVG